MIESAVQEHEHDDEEPIAPTKLRHYQCIARAIEFIRRNYQSQPSLNEMAGAVNLSPYHFQRLFSEWAGISPKKFVQFLSVEHAKRMLESTTSSVLQAALETGLSSTGRLHDLFIHIEGMTPGEFKNGGRNLVISYRFAETLFGQVLVASTAKGICYLGFVHDPASALTELNARFPNAIVKQQSHPLQQQALAILAGDREQPKRIHLHLRATPFQLKVWQALLTIPSGQLTSYGALARRIDQPTASRAVGAAIGRNPVAYLIPCHRVIQAGGEFGDYHWGATRKMAIIGWEAAQRAPV